MAERRMRAGLMKRVSNPAVRRSVTRRLGARLRPRLRISRTNRMMKSRIPAMVTIPHRRSVFRPNWQFAIDTLRLLRFGTPLSIGSVLDFAFLNYRRANVSASSAH